MTPAEILTAAADEAQIRGIRVGADDVTDPLVAMLRHSAARVRINPDALIDMDLILAHAILGEVAS